MRKTPNRIIVINTISAGLTQGLSLIMMPVYSYLLGKESYGMASMYTTWVNTLAVVIGLQAAASIAIAQRDFNEGEQLKYQANGVYLGLFMTLGFLMLSFPLSSTLSGVLELPAWSIYLIVLHAFGLFCIGMLNSKFTYELKQERNLILSVTISVGTALLSVITILNLPQEHRYLGKTIGSALPTIIAGIFLCGYLLVKVGICLNKVYLRYMIAYGAPLVFSSLCQYLFTNSDRIMLQKMQSNGAVGIYSLAYSFSAVVSVIWSALNHAWSPFYYRYEAAGNDEILLEHVKNYTRLFSIITIGFILLSPEVFTLFSAPEFWDGKILVPLFAIGFYADFVGCFARNHQYYYKKTKRIALVSIGTSIINLGLNLVWIPKIGALGAAAATAVSQLAAMTVSWIMAKSAGGSKRRWPYKKNEFVFYFLLIGISTALFYLDGTKGIRWAMGIVLGLYQAKKMIKTRQIF